MEASNSHSRPNWRQFAKTFPFGMEYGGGMGLTVPRKKKCTRCGRLVEPMHMERHQDGHPCQLRTTIAEQKLVDWWACSRQLAELLATIEVDYKIETKTLAYKKVSRSGYPHDLVLEFPDVEMPVLFVRGLPGILAHYFKARPLRWALKRLEDQEFRDAIATILLMETELEKEEATVQFVEEQWQNRKGHHRNKKVQARRAKAPKNKL